MMYYSISCMKCGHAEDEESFRCSRCNGILEVKFDYSAIKLPEGFKSRRISTAKYLPFLPIDRLRIALGEGNTPLARRSYKGERLLLKLETDNPTNSFKDRGSVVEINKALELGVERVCCASTGNMGISVARYAKHAGIAATIFLSRDANKIKIEKIRKNGARLLEVSGDFNKAMQSAESFAIKSKAMVCGDYHYRKEGQKTVIYEILQQCSYNVPDFIFAPVGNSTLLAAMYKGLSEFKRFGLIKKFPRMVAVQSSKCAPLVRAYNSDSEVRYVKPNTIADAIAVGYPTFGFEGIDALKKTNGIAVAVSEDEIKNAVRMLGRMKVGAETGGAAGFAGFISLYSKRRSLLHGKKIVVIVTGNNER